MSPKRSFKILISPLLVFCLALVPLIWDQQLRTLQISLFPQTLHSFRHVVLILIWISGGWLLSRLIDLFVWDFAFSQRLKTAPPRLLQEIGHVLIALIVLTGILGGVFGLPVSGIWATSGAVGLVLGLALQNTITDAFSGLAMNFDNALSIGDWVQLHQKGLPSYTGQVIQVSWRTTQILTNDNVTVIFPNSLLAKISIVNLSRPYPSSRFKLDLTFPLYLPQERVCRALEVALNTTHGIIHTPKAPKVKLRSINKLGIVYQLRYWVDPLHISPSSVRSLLMISVQKSLHHAGIEHSIPTYQTDLPKEAPAIDWSDSRLALLRKTTLFNPLPEEDLTYLAHHMKYVYSLANTVLVREGEQGDSMFLIAEGCVEVRINEQDYSTQLDSSNTSSDSEDSLVAQTQPSKRVTLLSSGDYFGENSLLTGETRNATLTTLTSTVCFEITYSMMRTFLKEHPHLIEQLSHTLAQRIKSTSQHRQRISSTDESTMLSDSMSLKIRRFFGFLNSL